VKDVTAVSVVSIEHAVIDSTVFIYCDAGLAINHTAAQLTWRNIGLHYSFVQDSFGSRACTQRRSYVHVHAVVNLNFLQQFIKVETFRHGALWVV
jgi:hypothetical protein